LGPPYRFGPAPHASLPAAPACGAHSEVLLAEAGYAREEIDALRRAGVIAGPMDETRARGALLQTLPLFEMMRMRAATTARRHPVLGFASEHRDSTLRWVNQFPHTHRRLGPDDREVVSPNNDTVYSN